MLPHHASRAGLMMTMHAILVRVGTVGSFPKYEGLSQVLQWNASTRQYSLIQVAT